MHDRFGIKVTFYFLGRKTRPKPCSKCLSCASFLIIRAHADKELGTNGMMFQSLQIQMGSNK